MIKREFTPRLNQQSQFCESILYKPSPLPPYFPATPELHPTVREIRELQAEFSLISDSTLKVAEPPLQFHPIGTKLNSDDKFRKDLRDGLISQLPPWIEQS